jgi:hypothetical protein
VGRRGGGSSVAWRGMFVKSYERLDDDSSHHCDGELDHAPQDKDEQKMIMRKKKTKYKDEESKPLLLTDRLDDDEEEQEDQKDKKEKKIEINIEEQLSHERSVSPEADPEPHDSSAPRSPPLTLAQDVAETASGSHPLVLLYQTPSFNSDETPTKEAPKFTEETKLNEESKVPTPPPKPPKPIQKSTNPFDEELPPSSAPVPSHPQKSTNPFDEEAAHLPSSSPRDPPQAPNQLQKSKSTNPFDPNYDGVSKSSKPIKKSQSVGVGGVSTNPFDTGETPANKSTLKLQSSPSSPSSIGSSSLPQSPSTSSQSLQKFSENSPEYSDLIILLQLGFQPSSAYQSIMTHKDLNLALQSLRNDLLYALNHKTIPNWYPPILTRIGSWMPSQSNSSSRVLYYIKVQINHSDLAYVITKRFSEFVSFYQQISQYFHRNCQNLSAASASSNATAAAAVSPNPNNVLVPFVDDRISGYLWGTSEELCNRRQDMLHKWLSFLCLSERMMTDLAISQSLREFLQVDAFIKKVPVLTGNAERPLTLQ